MPAPTPSTAAAAFQTTLDLFQLGLDLMRQNLRRRHPEANDEVIERLLDTWLRERPGAPSGDCPGPVVHLNSHSV